MDKKISYKWQFIGSLIVVSLIAIISYICLAHSFHQRLNRIEEIQIEDCKRMAYLFAPINHEGSPVGKLRNAEIERFNNAMEKHEERMESMLEMEFGKLQNDFNLISIWAGIITIVFLIFSIYSIFKTDEMLKKSDDIYEQIKGKADAIGNISNNIQREYRTELDSLKKESDNYIKEMAQKITVLNERIANADSMLRQYKEAAQADEIVQASADEQDVQEINKEA